jgi:outer membrane protein OmpA-like peptidoglycan-associated protein
VELPPTALTPPPLPAAVRAPEPQQVAALPATPAPAPAAVLSSKNDTLSVAFASESSHLSETAHAELDRLIKRMQKDESLTLQLLAYAEGDDANASKARRLSLSRALEVRKYLMEQGLRSTRIEVRALGNKLDGAGTADRVDAVLVVR